ncbi:glycerophosphodiester phosphodiesterase [Chitinophaga pinensis]|uniref:glycerophosphodiester phosphodiesterase n=1 Tax=Chitinophaga pinensis TaxID=79329 RepID=UPI001646C7B0|nr:glycerophosphodiester phosphodiesterase family protein [Chitinophaga pinensis]
MKQSVQSLLFIVLLLASVKLYAQSQPPAKSWRLIAHRGGVVDSTTDQNSKEALIRAIAEGYWMVEVDLRMTKDSVLITHHDKNFRHSFGLDATVSSMTWEAISKLRNANGYRVQRFEEVLAQCKGKLGVMIDNKLEGNDTAVWTRLITLLQQYDLYKSALMIGTDESTEYFTGKIRLSCTREQLETNINRPDYKASNYYLFSDKISREDYEWAHRRHMLVVGVINAWAFQPGEAVSRSAEQAAALKGAGVQCFQIDAEYLPLFQR